MKRRFGQLVFEVVHVFNEYRFDDSECVVRQVICNAELRADLLSSSVDGFGLPANREIA